MSKEFPQKYLNKIKDLPDFIDGIEAADTDELKKKIITFEGHIYDTENAKDADEELLKVREQAKIIAAPYRETKNIETAKIKYCLFVLENRGVKI